MKKKKQKKLIIILIISILILFIVLFFGKCGKDEKAPIYIIFPNGLTQPFIMLTDPNYADRNNSDVRDLPGIDTSTPSSETQVAGSRIHYVYGENSGQALNYIVYAPEDCNEMTPIFMFLHGNAEVNHDPNYAMGRYVFLKNLNYGSWQPEVIIVFPLAERKSYWSSEVNSLDTILNEVINNYGGSRDLMYIGGASAGADAMSSIAKKINFQGAIYMAGHLTSGSMNANDFLNLWSGKTVFYCRDNLFSGGGYGYSKSLVAECKEKASSHYVHFYTVDLNWNHDIGLVDAALMPTRYADSKGKSCFNVLELLIYGD